MSERDPRVEPRPGDVLKLLGAVCAREVVTVKKTIVGWTCDVSEPETCWDLFPQWRKWAKGAEVIRRAEDEATSETPREPSD